MSRSRLAMHALSDSQLRVLCRLLLVTGSFVWLPMWSHAQSPNCPGANPNDSLPDNAAIQTCLDAGGTVVLDGNGPGFYRIAGSIRIPSNTTLTSVGTYRALLEAEDGLLAPMITTDYGAQNYALSRIWLYGKKYSRTHRDSYCFNNYDAKQNGYNAIFVGEGFVIDDVESAAAMCGTGMYVSGSNFEVKNSWFANNGIAAPTGPWADGLTVTGCYNGYIHHNHFVDNTDVDLIIGDGVDCRVTYNEINHYGTYGFAGFMVHNFWATGQHDGSWYAYNSVASTYNSLAFGIMVGPRGWDGALRVYNPTVVYNSASGAVINLAVDGVTGGFVSGNSTSNHQGSRGYNCTFSADYTVGDTSGVVLDPDWTFLRFSPGTCWW